MAYAQTHVRPHYIAPSHAWPPLAAKRLSKDNLTLHEYYRFVAIVLLGGIVRFPTWRHFWTHAWPYNNIMAPVKLTRARFDTIKAMLHFVPELEVPQDGDALYKVQIVLDRLKDRCESVYHIGRHSSGDECMIKLESKNTPNIKYSGLKKPISEGVVVDAICESAVDVVEERVFVKVIVNLSDVDILH